MLKGQELDQFLDEFLDGARPAMDEKQDSPEELEEYQLPSDGLIIRQMKRQGKVSRRTWFALVLMLLTVPLLLYLSVRIFHGRKYLVTSLIVVVAAMLPFFMMQMESVLHLATELQWNIKEKHLRKNLGKP